MAHIPSWLPGGEFKQQAAECRVLVQEVLNGPVQYVVDNMVITAIFLQLNRRVKVTLLGCWDGRRIDCSRVA